MDMAVVAYIFEDSSVRNVRSNGYAYSSNAKVLGSLGMCRNLACYHNTITN